MSAGGNKNNDFDLESAFENDDNLENIFNDNAEKKKEVKVPDVSEAPEVPEFQIREDVSPADQGDFERVVEKRRSSKDFELDMDAILITAQSSLIIEGIKHYAEKDFGPHTLTIYKETLNGILLYIKLIDRNPNNYRKLKKVIDTDIDCQKVENTVFNLYRKIYKQPPETDQEKVIAFEKFKQLFMSAVDKATVSSSAKMMKKYFLLSGGVDEEKVRSGIQSGNMELKTDINCLHQQVKIAIDMVNRGDFEIAKGLRGRDLNAYIINAAYLLGYYFGKVGNQQAASYYERVHNNFKKYFIMK